MAVFPGGIAHIPVPIGGPTGSTMDGATGGAQHAENHAAIIAEVEAIESTLGANLANVAPLASPTFTGVPEAPTATTGTSTTQLATTAFVQGAVGSGGPANLKKLPASVGKFPQIGPRILFGEYCYLTEVTLPDGAQADSEAAMEYRETQVGRQFDLFNNYIVPWTANLAVPDERYLAAGKKGRTVIVSWAMDTLSTIVAGTDDAQITQIAQAWAAYPYPVIIRMGWEMNLPTYAWGQQPALYIQAWQHIWNLFQAAGATNVAWFWCPNVASLPSSTVTGVTGNVLSLSTSSNAYAVGMPVTGSGGLVLPANTTVTALGTNTITISAAPTSGTTGTVAGAYGNWRQYYPGDGYVDYIGADGYSMSSASGWADSSFVFGSIFPDFASGMGGLTSGKPIFVGEWGCASTPINRPFWLRDAAAYFKTVGVAALAYFDTDNSGATYAFSTTADVIAWANVAGDPVFGGVSQLGESYDLTTRQDNPLDYMIFPPGGPINKGSNGGTPTVSGTPRFNVPPMSPGLSSPGVIFKNQADNGGAFEKGHVSIGVMGSFGSEMATGVTLEWLYMDDPTAGGTANKVFGVANSASSQLVLFESNVGGVSGAYELKWVSNAGLSRTITWSGVVSDGNQHHMVWTINPTGSDTVTIDGVLQSTTVVNAGSGATFNNFNVPMVLGTINAQGSISDGSGATCGLDRFASYGAILTPTQIGYHYNALIGGTITPMYSEKKGSCTVNYGVGVPTIAGALGDVWQRLDTPSTPGQVIYICTTAGTPSTAIWTPLPTGNITGESHISTAGGSLAPNTVIISDYNAASHLLATPASGSVVPGAVYAVRRGLNVSQTMSVVPGSGATVNGASSNISVSATGERQIQAVYLVGTSPTNLDVTSLLGTDAGQGFTTFGTLATAGHVNFSAGAAFTTPTLASGTASQISTSSDVDLYLTIGTGGTFTLAIGPTSTPADTIFSGIAVVTGQTIHVRVPATWYVLLTLVTATIAAQKAVSYGT
jgi:hypothetical protein